jgi:hypothetical protein
VAETVVLVQVAVAHTQLILVVQEQPDKALQAELEIKLVQTMRKVAVAAQAVLVVQVHLTLLAVEDPE